MSRRSSGETSELLGDIQAERRTLLTEEQAMAEEEIGRVTHYFGKIGVAAIEITRGSLAIGDTIHIQGHTSDFVQQVESMQIENKPVDRATAGQSVGIKVVQHARPHDKVYKVLPD